MSAQGYTNKVRVSSEARLIKVQFPGKVGDNKNPLQSSIALSPSYTQINYSIACVCQSWKVRRF